MTNNEAAAVKALRDVIAILDAIPAGGDQTFYEIGRAIGTAKMGLFNAHAPLLVPPYAVLREDTLKVGRE